MALRKRQTIGERFGAWAMRRIPKGLRAGLTRQSLASLPIEEQRSVFEALTGTALGDYSGTSEGERGWRSLGRRAVLRDLDAESYRTMLRVVRWLYCEDMLGGWLIDKPVDLAIGTETGYDIAIDAGLAKLTQEQAKDATKRIRDYLDPWWENPLFDLRHDFDGLVTSFLVDGCLTLQIVGNNGATGLPMLDLIDATQLDWEGPAPMAGRSTVPGSLKFMPANESTSRQYRIAQVEPDTLRYASVLPSQDRGLETPPPDAALANMGTVFYWRNSRIPNSMRGFSELLAAADWIDGLGNFFWTALDRARLVNSIVWGVTMKQATPKMVAERLQEIRKNPPTVPGQTYVHNENETWEAKTGNFGAHESAALLRSVKNYILGSKSLPEGWYAEGGETNRATLSEQGDPTYASLARVQKRAGRIGRDLLNYGYDQVWASQGKGDALLPPRIDERGRQVVTFSATLPALNQKDAARLSTGVTQLVPGLADAETNEYVSRKTSRRVFLSMMSQLSGVEVEPDEELALIEEEREAREQRKAVADAENAAKGYAKAFAGMSGKQGGADGQKVEPQGDSEDDARQS